MTNDLTTVSAPRTIQVWLDWGIGHKNPRPLRPDGKLRYRYVFKRHDGIMQIGGVDAYSRLDALDNLKKQYKIPEHITLQLVSSLGDL